MVTLCGRLVCRSHLKDRATIRLLEIVSSSKTINTVRNRYDEITKLL